MKDEITAALVLFSWCVNDHVKQLGQDLEYLENAVEVIEKENTPRELYDRLMGSIRRANEAIEEIIEALKPKTRTSTPWHASSPEFIMKGDDE